jgi:hypothetical protein
LCLCFSTNGPVCLPGRIAPPMPITAVFLPMTPSPTRMCTRYLSCMHAVKHSNIHKVHAMHAGWSAGQQPVPVRGIALFVPLQKHSYAYDSARRLCWIHSHTGPEAGPEGWTNGCIRQISSLFFTGA